MMHLIATVTIQVPINDETEEDPSSEICDALEIVKKQIGEGFTSGFDKNDTGVRYQFSVQEEA